MSSSASSPMSLPAPPCSVASSTDPSGSAHPVPHQARSISSSPCRHLPSRSHNNRLSVSLPPQRSPRSQISGLEDHIARGSTSPSTALLLPNLRHPPYPWLSSTIGDPTGFTALTSFLPCRFLLHRLSSHPARHAAPTPSEAPPCLLQSSLSSFGISRGDVVSVQAPTMTILQRDGHARDALRHLSEWRHPQHHLRPPPVQRLHLPRSQSTTPPLSCRPTSIGSWS